MIQSSHPQKCFTIGYGDYSIEVFVGILIEGEIDTLIDARSSPFSKYNPDYNRDNLEKFLNSNHIVYRHMGDKLGGRYSDPDLLFPDGTVDYQKVRDTKLFREGINQVISFIISGNKIALMCAEKEPERCHRFSLISRALQESGIKVIHILPGMKLMAHDDLEKELVDSMIDMEQRTLSGERVDPVDLLYERLNKKIVPKMKRSENRK